MTASTEGQDNKEQQLMEHCKKFIKDQKISCADAIGQTDSIIENAYGFIEGVCDIVGYHEDES